MPALSLDKLSHAFAAQPLLDNVDLVIEHGERIALVGRNGSGKSTLLKIIQGAIQPEGGRVVREEGVTIATMPQEVPREWQGTVLEHLLDGIVAGPAFVAYEDALRRLEQVADDKDAIAKMQQAHDEIERAGGWEIRRALDEVVSLLELNPHDPVQSLSGGQARRVLLGKALVSAPDVLILDEPTNHLDIPSVEKLEDLIRRRQGTLLFVSHDRAFVDRVATRIVELDRGRLFSYPAGWENFVLRRQERLEVEAEHQKQFDRRLSEEEAWIRQGIKARRTRNEGRVRRLVAMRRERQQRREQGGKAKLTIQEAERSGRLVVDAVDVCFAYNGEPTVEGFHATILRGDRVGIIGPNGCGKTTLIKLMLGELQPQRGSLRRGTNLQVAYFDQYREQLDPDARVWETVAEGSDFVEINGNRRHVMSWLADFLFSSERARSPVRVLSGGERHRLLLARLFARPTNLLVLDEPTNDLDLETLELLEERVDQFGGTVLIVSHDRAFLNHVVTSTIAYEEGRGFVEYVGGYDDWLKQRPQVSSTTADDVAEKRKGDGAAAETTQQRKKVRKLSYKQQRELESLPENIEELEARQQELGDAMGDPALYQPGSEQRLQQTQTELADVQTRLETAYGRWEELETLREELAER